MQKQITSSLFDLTKSTINNNTALCNFCSSKEKESSLKTFLQKPFKLPENSIAFGRLCNIQEIATPSHQMKNFSYLPHNKPFGIIYNNKTAPDTVMTINKEIVLHTKLYTFVTLSPMFISVETDFTPKFLQILKLFLHAQQQ